MATPPPAAPKEPMQWWQPLIGAVFAVIVVTGLGLATAASFDNEMPDKYDSHGDEHSDEEHGDDHSDDDHGDGDHSDDHADDEDHSDEG